MTQEEYNLLFKAVYRVASEVYQVQTGLMVILAYMVIRDLVKGAFALGRRNRER